MPRSSRKVAIRIVTPDPERVSVKKDEAGGLLLFVPKGSSYTYSICLQAVELVKGADGIEHPQPDALDTRHIAVRPSPQKHVKQKRRTLHFKDR